MSAQRTLVLTPEQVDNLRHLVEVEKLQQWKISGQTGWSTHTITMLCRRHGILTQRTGPRAGPGHPKWKGGRVLDKSGYVLLYMPDHPDACVRNKSGAYIREHRWVMEQALGRRLLPTEVVDHINGQKGDNRLENLRLYQTNADHLRETLAGKCPKWTPEGVSRIAEGKQWKPETIARLRAEAYAAENNAAQSRQTV
jgi:hypothetical protein